MLALNTVGLMSRLPRVAFRPSPTTGGEGASREPVAHWIAVRQQGERIAARTLECRGDYRGAAQSAVIFARELIDDNGDTRVGAGVFGPEDLLSLDRLAPDLNEAGITVVDRQVHASAEPAA